MNTEKILLVDDERAIRLAVRTALTREGMQVTEAADGSEALELLKKQQFHLVILDVMMDPTLSDGTKLLRLTMALSFLISTVSNTA